MAVHDTVSGTSDRWLAVAEQVTQRRTVQLRQTQSELVRRDLSVTNIGKLESGRALSYRGATIRALEDALGWLHGSVQRILDGGEPAVDPNQDSGAAPAGRGPIVTGDIDSRDDLAIRYARRPGWTPERQTAFEELVRNAADLIFGEEKPTAKD